jgi:hypothetical protein
MVACLLFSELLVPGIAVASDTNTTAGEVELLIRGPEPERGKLQLALRSLLGADPALSWTGQEGGEAPAEAAAHGPPRILIDVAHAGEIRIFVPARDIEGQVSIRTVPAQEGSAPDDAIAARETVAQIVAEAVRALRSVHRATTAATAPPLTAPPAAVTLGEAARPAAPASPRKTAVELTLAAGAHTAPFKMAEPSSESNWLGPSVQGQIRWRVGKAAFALRSGWEKSQKTIDWLWLRTQFYSMTLAALRRVEVDKLDLGIGLELGALYVRQSTEMNYDYPGVMQMTFGPGTLRDTQSLGFLFGPILEANLKLTERWFFHLDFAASINGLDVKGGSVGWKTGWTTSPNLHGLMGLGIRI